MFRFLHHFTAFCDEENAKSTVFVKNKTATEFVLTPSKDKKSNKASSGVKDPFSCLDPTCSDKMSVFKNAMEHQKSTKVSALEIKSDSAVTTEVSSAPTEVSKAERAVNDQSSLSSSLDCPLDRSELGHSTWNFLHTLAAYYPNQPSPEYQKAVVSLMESLALLYPCKYCAAEFQVTIKESPPK
jgi:hypothetical protein